MRTKSKQIWKRKKEQLDVLILLVSQEPGRPWVCIEFYSVGGGTITAYEDSEFENFHYLGTLGDIV